MKKVITNIVDIVANSLQYAIAIEDINEIGNTIYLGLAIICSLIIIVPKIIRNFPKLIKWFKKSIKDGKISKEELEEGKKIIEDEESGKE